jgi:hypothetical protein
MHMHMHLHMHTHMHKRMHKRMHKHVQSRVLLSFLEISAGFTGSLKVTRARRVDVMVLG